MVVLLGLLLAALPYYHAYSVLSCRLPPTGAALGATLALGAFTYGFWRVGPPAVEGGLAHVAGRVNLLEVRGRQGGCGCVGGCA